MFDDISEMVSAQRAQAWGEVARRLAHEIKNPLTPIQLSAERLEMKLTGKVAPAEQALLTKSVKTIVDQVDAMKRLVNEFRDYARLPAAELKPVDLNALVSDVLQLYAQRQCAAVPVQSPSSTRNARRFMGDAQQLRQVMHNLLQNAQDATGRRRTDAPRDRSKPTSSKARSRVRLMVQDNGTGFPSTSSSAPLSPMSPPRSKAPAWGWRWSRKSPTSTAPASIFPTASLTVWCRALKCRYHSPLRLDRRSAPASNAASATQSSTTGRTAIQSWQIFWWSTTSWASATCSRKFSMTRAIRSIWPKTPRKPALPARADRPDLVLLDIWMPDTDGVTLLKEWSSSGLLTMPVIMMSGHATIDTAVEATKIGAMAFLEKPITLQKLLKAVEQGLAQNASPASRASAAAARAVPPAGRLDA